MTVLARVVQWGPGEGGFSMGSHTNPTNHPFPAITQTVLYRCFLWGFIPFWPVLRLEQPDRHRREGSGWQRGAADQCKPLSLRYMLLLQGLPGY